MEVPGIHLLETRANRPPASEFNSPLGGIMVMVSTHRKNVSWQEEEEEEAAVSKADENNGLIRRLIEAQDKADLETLDELLTSSFVDYSLLPDQEPGCEGYMQSVAKDHAIVSNIRTNIEYPAADGDPHGG